MDVASHLDTNLYCGKGAYPRRPLVVKETGCDDEGGGGDGWHGNNCYVTGSEVRCSQGNGQRVMALSGRNIGSNDDQGGGVGVGRLGRGRGGGTGGEGGGGVDTSDIVANFQPNLECFNNEEATRHSLHLKCLRDSNENWSRGPLDVGPEEIQNVSQERGRSCSPSKDPRPASAVLDISSRVNCMKVDGISSMKTSDTYNINSFQSDENGDDGTAIPNVLTTSQKLRTSVSDCHLEKQTSVQTVCAGHRTPHDGPLRDGGAGVDAATPRGVLGGRRMVALTSDMVVPAPAVVVGRNGMTASHTLPALSDLILSPSKLLDKLLVVCPNIDYCEEVLPRCELQAHLAHRCKGAVTKCLKWDVGCSFQGPRSALHSHLWECPFRDIKHDPPSLARLPVLEGDVTTIDIQRGCYDLGISVVGGTDTPLMCIVIQEVFPDGVVAKDHRLLPGDQILEVNGVDLTSAPHEEARGALRQVYPICRLTVYREKADEHGVQDKEDVFKVALPKVSGKQLGIKLVGKKGREGLYVLEMVGGGIAAMDNRLKRDDRILEINCQDMTHGTQEQAAQIIQASVDKVQLVVSRRVRPETPDLIRSASRECLMSCTLPLPDPAPASLRTCREKLITINKDPTESLGVSVAGGYGNPRGDIPIYITNIQAPGCLGRTRQIKKGDVMLAINGHPLLDLGHTEAVRVLKAAAESRVINLKLLDGPETCDGMSNFCPSWRFWLCMPVMCHTVKTLTLERAPSGTLGFSIVGGNDSGQGPVPIYVKSVVPNTPAGKDGRLRSGDMLLSVNGQCLENVPHSQAVNALKGAKGQVTLRVVSWPGTPV